MRKQFGKKVVCAVLASLLVFFAVPTSVAATYDEEMDTGITFVTTREEFPPVGVGNP